MAKSMLNVIAKFMDYDPLLTSKDDIYSDFLHKYRDTYILINNEFYYVTNLHGNTLYVLTLNNEEKDFGADDIHVIEKFMPETGLYKSDTGLLYLYRIPARQYLKSFAPGQNYETIVLENRKGTTVKSNVLVSDPNFYPETCIFDKNVYLGWIKVGTKGIRTIYLEKPQFLEEIRELWPQYMITTEPNPQQKHTEEKLILDF